MSEPTTSTKSPGYNPDYSPPSPDFITVRLTRQQVLDLTGPNADKQAWVHNYIENEARRQIGWALQALKKD